MSDSVRPHRRQPLRLPRPWDSPGKNTGVGCHFLLQCTPRLEMGGREGFSKSGCVGTVFPIKIPLLSGPSWHPKQVLFRLGTSSKAGGGATRWPDSVVIRELSWRSVAVAEAMPQSRPISVFCPLSPLLKKVLEPHHLLAEQSVAGNQPAGEETPPQPPPGKFDAKVGPESVSSG